jgi:multidrug resistance efflux pump
MSRIQNNTPETVDTVLQQKLEPWINNPPEYDIMIETYKRQGRLKSQIRIVKRNIERAEELITSEIDRPRSNEAKVKKLNATATLKDQLAEYESELEIIESEVKALEFMKTMFNASNYRTRLAEQYT